MSAKNCYFVAMLLLVSAFLQAQNAPEWQSQRIGRVHDWTSSHVLASGGLTDENLRLARMEPRILMQLGVKNVFPNRATEEFPSPDSNPIQRPGTKIIDGGG